MKKMEFVSLNRQEYALGNLQEHVEMILYAVIVFSLPFILGHEQLLVGSVVNCALVLAALNLRGWKLLPIIILPSVGVFFAGLVFGSLTSSLIYMIPFVWIGNAVLVLSIKELALNRKNNRFASLGFGAAAKTVFLFGSALALLYFGLVPAAFLAAFGALQLYTAIIGGTGALAIQEIKRRIMAA